MSSYFYRGRHRRPTHTGRNLAVMAASSAIALPLSGMALSGTANADILDEIERCESGGNHTAQNPSSTASGAFQFLDSTWRSVTGLGGSASDYSYAQQRAAAEKLHAQQGTAPWNASKSCWGGSGASGVTPRAHKATPKATSKARARTTAPAPRAVSDKRAADGTGSYVCTTSMLGFAACDPDTLGRIVAFPRYDGHAPKTSWRAAALRIPAPPADLHRRDHRGNGSYTCDAAHLGYDACDPGTLGQTVAYPLFDKYR